jgi:hypothetical protein
MPRASKPLTSDRTRRSARNGQPSHGHRSLGLRCSPSIARDHLSAVQQNHSANSVTSKVHGTSVSVDAMPDNVQMASIARVPPIPRRPLQREYAFIISPSPPPLCQARTSAVSGEAGTEDERDSSPPPALDLASASMSMNIHPQTIILLIRIPSYLRFAIRIW